MTDSPYRAVIFDLDGLMLDTESIYRVIWQKAAKDMGQDLSDELFMSFIGRRDEECEAMLLELWGDEFPVRLMREYMASLWAEHVAHHEIPKKAGLMELIDFLDAQGIKKAVATSSGKEKARAKLGGLIERFGVVVTGDEVTRGKPAPDIFLLAAKRLGLGVGECLVLEDSRAGLAAAKAAGIDAIVVPDLIAPDDPEAHVCASLHEVQAWLKTQTEPVKA